ncbi:MAG: 30S ribosome-binding factor RbfA [bacterium]
MPERMPKVNQLIKQVLSQAIYQEIEFPKNILVTVTKVETARDLKTARIWVSIMPASHGPMILKKLAKEAGQLQSLLNEKISLRFIPKLRFIWDHAGEKVNEIEELFQQIARERQE